MKTIRCGDCKLYEKCYKLYRYERWNELPCRQAQPKKDIKPKRRAYEIIHTDESKYKRSQSYWASPYRKKAKQGNAQT